MNLNIRTFTFGIGVAFSAFGILGFIPGITHAPLITDPSMTLNVSYGRLFGLFPVNILHNLIHLGFGIWAVVAARDTYFSRDFCKVSSVLYMIIAVIGIVPGLNTVFGLIPLFGHDVWLHIGIAAVTGYYGYVWKGVSEHRRST